MPSSNHSARPGRWTAPAGFFTILLVEFLIDIFPVDLLFDWILIPVEIVVDLLYLLFAYWAMRSPVGSGRRLRGRRAVGTGAVVILGYWTFFVVVLAIEFWFLTQNPLLGFFALFIELPFDFLLFVGGLLLTWVALRSSGPRGATGRQLGSR